MQSRLASLFSEASAQGPAEKAQSALALIRITLQHACTGLAEWIINNPRALGGDGALDGLDFEGLREPSDGTLVSELARLLVVAENLGWLGATRFLWDPTPAWHGGNSLTEARRPNLEEVLKGLVAARNDGVEGHGLPGARDPEVWLAVAHLTAQRLSPLLPAIDADSNLLFKGNDGQSLQLRLMRVFEGKLTCYRSIKTKEGGRCTVRAQIQLTLTHNQETAWEAPDLLSYNPFRQNRYEIAKTASTGWCPLALVPARLTGNFSGRKEQLAELADWFDDIESPACLLYGDGGVGKTTLAVEFLHQLLEGRIETTWKPQVLTFYTAKQTRWGIDGLEVIRAAPGNIKDLSLEIFRALSETPPDRSWYDKPADATVEKLVAFIDKWGFTRKEHLIVLDNTETMTASEQDAQILAKHIRMLARKVGRVLLTSRRREPVEARLVEVPPLSGEESVALLRARGKELGRSPVLQAGDPKLRQIAEKLGNRPLVLEVFLQTLRDESLSLERAFDRVLQMERQDLGEFLYADAWRRMSEPTQKLLYLMTRVADAHDDALVKLCCQEVGVSVSGTFAALEESRGIASITRIGGQAQVVFSSDFLQFASGRDPASWRDFGAVAERVERVKKRYSDFVKSKTARIKDRVSHAYRRPFARMAWQAFQDGRLRECEDNYELAVVDDPENGLLFDRYAYFLFTERRFEDAMEKAREATRLLPTDSETWFTRGLIESRTGNAEAAERSLMRAEELGKALHLCRLQMAYGYSNAKPPRTSDAFAALTIARDSAPPRGNPQDERHLAEVETLRKKVASQVRRRRVGQ